MGRPASALAEPDRNLPGSPRYAYQKARIEERLAKLDETRKHTLSLVVGPTDPCRRCEVRPSHHDEFGCRRYVGTDLKP